MTVDRAKPARSILGYLRLGTGASAYRAEDRRKHFAEFAEREGFELVDVFIDVESAATSGFAALVDAARRMHVRVVAIPSSQQFARLPGLDRAMREVLGQAGVEVVAIDDEVQPGRPDAPFPSKGLDMLRS